MTSSAIFAQLTDNQIVATILLIVAVFLTRIILEKYLSRRASWEQETRRRIISDVKNALFLLLLIGLVLIWAPALRTFALSLTAFAVAIILATKELILCVSGSVVKTMGGSMRIGQWVEVHGIRGEVVDQSLLTTRIEELGTGASRYEFTGRSIVIPNSQFVNTPVINERFFKRYVIHSFYMIVEANNDIPSLEEALVTKVNAEMEPHIEQARRYNELVEKRAGIDIVDLKPATNIGFTNEGRIRLSVTAFLPTKHAQAIEQSALREALKLVKSPCQP